MRDWNDEARARGQRRADAQRATDAQAEYVRQWREQHPDDVYDSPWICPLCGMAVQRFATAYASEHDKAVQRWVNYHQRDHDADWTAYASLAAPAGDAGEGE